MGKSILGSIEGICNEYRKFQARLVRPDLKQLVATIIDYEQRHLEELREADSELLSAINAAGVRMEASFSSSQTSAREGLEAMRQVCRGLAESWERISSSVDSSEASILSRQLAGDERKMAGLLDDRLELEALLG